MNNLLYYIKNSNLTIEKLSLKSGILPEKLNALVLGNAEASISDIRKIAKALKLSIDFLVTENSKFQDINVLFRKNFRNDKEQFIIEKCSHVIGNSLEILSNDYIPKFNFLNTASLLNDFKGATTLANEFRAKYFNADFYSPFLKLPEILANELNCIIYVMELGDDFEGASVIYNNVPFIFISPRFEPRMLFTLAHELAHILAHHKNNIQDFAILEKNFSNLKIEGSFSEESFANYFASALLLPAEGVGTTLKKVRKHLNIDFNGITDIEILYLSRIYGVSFEVAASRCEHLGITPKGTANSLYQKLKSEHGSPEKRADALNLPARTKLKFSKVSSNLIHCAIRKINSGQISLGKASEILSISMPDLIDYHSKFE